MSMKNLVSLNLAAPLAEQLTRLQMHCFNSPIPHSSQSTHSSSPRKLWSQKRPCVNCVQLCQCT